MATLPPLGNPNTQLAEALKQLSAAKYGRPKAAVEAEIFKRMATQPAGPSLAGSTRPSLGEPPRLSPAPASLPPSTGPSAPKPASGSSFLDEWLAKRKKGAPQPPPQLPKKAESLAPENKPSAPPAKTAPKQEELPKDPKPKSEEKAEKPPEDNGTFKINQEDGVEQVHSVKIDRDGNLSYDG
jgi:hypothetical protein